MESSLEGPTVLEVSMGDGDIVKTFELLEVGPRTFMLKRKDTIVDLVQSLTEWCQENALMKEADYQDLLRRRAMVTNPTGKILQHYTENLGSHPTPEQNFNSGEILYLGDPFGKVLNFSINERKSTKDYGDLMDYSISAVATTSDRKYIFMGDEKGSLSQIDLDNGHLLREYPKLHRGKLKNMVITHDDQFIFTGDLNYGYIKQMSIAKMVLVKNYGPIMVKGIHSMLACPDNLFIYVGGFAGQLKRIGIGDESVSEDMGVIHKGPISAMAVSIDGKYLYTGSWDKTVKRVSTFDWTVKDYGPLMSNEIHSLEITKNNEFLLIGETLKLKMFWIKEEKMIKDFGRVHENPDWRLILGNDGKFFYTSDGGGYLKQWDTKSRTMVRDFDKIQCGISSFCF